MATGEKIPIDNFNVKLILSNAEAQALRDVCAYIGGHYIESERRYIQNISDALDKLGFTYRRDILTGSLDFIK